MPYKLSIRTNESDVPTTGHAAFDPPPSPVWVEVDEAPWRIALRFVAHDGRPTLAEVRFFPLDENTLAGEWSGEPPIVPNGGVPPALLRFPLGRVRDAAVIQFTDPGDSEWDDGWPNPAENWDDVAGQAGFHPGIPPRGRGRTPLSDEQLALIAVAYVEALVLQTPVNDHIVARLSSAGETVKRSSVPSRIVKARQRGFLTDTTSGQKGGELTRKAKTVLHEMGYTSGDEAT
jgi:hypothetical protein